METKELVHTNYNNPTQLSIQEAELDEWMTFGGLAVRLNESPDKYRPNPISKARVQQMAILGHLPESYGGNLLQTGVIEGRKLVKILEQRYAFKKRGRPNKKS